MLADKTKVEYYHKRKTLKEYFLKFFTLKNFYPQTKNGNYETDSEGSLLVASAESCVDVSTPRPLMQTPKSANLKYRKPQKVGT